MRRVKLQKGGQVAALLFALALAASAALWPPAAASADIPWAAGCTPVAEGEARTAASCGASLVEGEAGAGRWITVYANQEHVFMVVAGLRFDTRGDPVGVSGARWHRGWMVPDGFTARHHRGL